VRERGEKEDCYFLSTDRNTEQKLRARRSGSVQEVSPLHSRTRSFREDPLENSATRRCDRARD